MGEWLTKLRFPVLLLLLGALFIAPSMLTGLSITNLNPEPRDTVSWPLFIVGVVFAVIGVAVFLFEDGNLPSVRRSPVRASASGYSVQLGQISINLLFGRLEEVVPAVALWKADMVLLPTNEFFDEDCAAAANTACGSYLRARLPNHSEEFRARVVDQLKSCEIVGRFEKERGKVEDSYGIGTCLLITNGILPPAILLAAVAMKRADVGFQSNPAYVYQCIERMVTVATDQRISGIYLPLLGAGKGGLTPSASLMTILLSVSAAQRRLGGFDSVVNIVVFQKDQQSEPAIDKRSVARILSLAEAIHRLP